MDKFQKKARSAAHRYAMTSVVSPFTHREAVKDTEDSFLAGVYAQRDNLMKTVRTRKRGLSVEELLEQTFAKHIAKYYNGAENNKDLMFCVKNDIYEGIKWSIIKGWDEDE